MFSMFLDLRTLSFVLMLITIALSILMIFIWRTNRTYPGFGFWALSNVLIASGFLFLSLREIIPDFITVIIANSLTFAGVLFGFTGNRRFLGLNDQKVFGLVLLILHGAILGYFNYFDKQVIYRIVCSSVFLMIISGRNALDFRAAWIREGNISYRFVSAVYLLFAALMFARGGLTYWLSDIKSLYSPDGIQAYSFIVFIIFGIAWTFIYMILNNERLQQELNATKLEFEKLAATDFLTGINNNRRFFEIGDLEIQRARRFRHPLTLIMFDIDYFKKINDAHGHDAGDKVLLAIVDICKFNLRDMDTLGRLGGEEFGVLLPHTDIDVGKMVAGRLRRAFDETEIALPLATIEVTASFGVTEFYESDENLKNLLNRADTALYEAKQNGRNQVKAAAINHRAFSETTSEIVSAQVM